MTSATPPFPGAVALTRLRAYTSEAPDGLRGGTPHVHLLSTEAYIVVGGRGRVQTLGPQGFREIPLETGSMVWFTPGVIHRVINDDGALEILVVMQNAGLPEAGDMVITFSPEVLADPSAYAATAALPPDESTTAGTGDAARTRRDRGVEAFLELRRAVEATGTSALDAFYHAAGALVRERVPQWRALHADGPEALVRQTTDRLAALERGDVRHMQDGTVHVHGAFPPEQRMGCCGTLQPYLPE